MSDEKKTKIPVSRDEEEAFLKEARTALSREGYELEVVDKMGTFVLADDTDFKRLLKHSSVLAGDSLLEFTDKGISCAWLDPATVAFGRWTIPKTRFEEYRQTNEPAPALSFNRLAEILVDKPAGAHVKVHYTEPNRNIQVSMHQEQATRTYNVPFPDNPLDEPKNLPSMENYPDPTTALVNSQQLYEELRSAEKHFQSVKLTLDPDGTLNISGESDDGLTLDVDLEADIRVAGNAPAVARFSAEYLKKFFDGNRGLQYFCDEVEVFISKDHPVLFTARWGQGCEYVLMLAPRVED